MNFTLYKFIMMPRPKLHIRLKSVLVVAEHRNDALNPFTLNAISAAKKLADDVTVLVAGYECINPARTLSALKGLTKILVADDPAFNKFGAENLTALLVSIQNRHAFTHILGSATLRGKSLLPRIAAKLNAEAISDVVDIVNPHTFVRPIYGGQALITTKLNSEVIVLTVRPSAFKPCLVPEDAKLLLKMTSLTKSMRLNRLLTSRDTHHMETYLRLQHVVEGLSHFRILRSPIEEWPVEHCDLNMTSVLRQEFLRFDKAKLHEASVILCGGRGMKSADNFNQLYDLAKKMHAAVGASESAVYEGLASEDIEIGRYGKIVSPDLYMAFGVSGSIPHVEAIKESKMIIAVNNDPDAPIFKIAHYGLVADLSQVLDELQHSLGSQRDFIGVNI